MDDDEPFWSSADGRSYCNGTAYQASEKLQIGSDAVISTCNVLCSPTRNRSRLDALRSPELVIVQISRFCIASSDPSFDSSSLASTECRSAQDVADRMAYLYDPNDR